MEFVRIQGTYIRSDQIVELSVSQMNTIHESVDYILIVRILYDERVRHFSYDTRAKAMAAINTALKQIEYSKEV